MKKEIREKKLTRTRVKGAVGRAEIDTKGTVETGAVGTAETGAMVVAGGAAAGIPVFATTPGPSKVSVNGEIGIQIKGDRSKGVTHIHMYKEEIIKKGRRNLAIKKGEGGKGHIPMNSILGSTLSSSSL